MPQANTPEETSRLIGEAITSGDIDAALSLYEPDGTFAMPKGFGEGSVTGLDGLRDAFNGFLAMSPELTVNAEKTLLSGDTALVIGNWTLKARDAEGNDIETGRRYADVVRRQPDGTWLFVIDNPTAATDRAELRGSARLERPGDARIAPTTGAARCPLSRSLSAK